MTIGEAHELVAVMFTDITEFTMQAHRNEQAALAMLREEESIVRLIVSESGGRIVKSTGDGHLIEFSSARRAVRCAVEIQTALHEHNLVEEKSPIRLRIGLNLGDVERRDDDIFGTTVNVAARILPLSEPEGIVLTDRVAQHISGDLTYPVDGIGDRYLRGIDEPVAVHRVVLPWSPPVTALAPTALPRLAILPLRNISPDPADAYFSDGLTEELASTLGQIQELRVVSRSSVEHYLESDRVIASLGRELQVTAVLEGSVRKAGDRLRISLRLVDASSEEELWTHTFDRELTDVFAVQSEVGERTAASLRIRLVGAQRASLQTPQTTNMAAYGLYLQGLHYMQQPELVQNREAEAVLRKAIAEDAEFADAYSALANHLIGSIGESNSAAVVAPQARRLLERALELSPNSPSAHTAKGNLALQVDHNWAIAESEFRRSIQLNPSSTEPRFWYSFLLRALQRYSDAEEQMRICMDLDPKSVHVLNQLCSILRLSGRLEEALQFTDAVISHYVDPATLEMLLALTMSYQGRTQDASAAVEKSIERGMDPERLEIVMLQARLGRPQPAREKLLELEARAAETYVPLIDLALLAGSIGDADKAIELLDREQTDGDQGLWFIYQGPGLDPIRSDPRFIELLRRARLPTSAPFHIGARTEDATAR